MLKERQTKARDGEDPGNHLVHSGYLEGSGLGDYYHRETEIKQNGLARQGTEVKTRRKVTHPDVHSTLLLTAFRRPMTWEAYPILLGS